MLFTKFLGNDGLILQGFLVTREKSLEISWNFIFDFENILQLLEICFNFLFLLNFYAIKF